MRHITILVAIVAFGMPFPTMAQRPPTAGEWVRVTHLPDCPPAYTRCWGRPVKIAGRPLELTPDSLVMESDGETLTLPLDLVTGLDAGRGRKPNSAKGHTGCQALRVTHCK